MGLYGGSGLACHEAVVESDSVRVGCVGHSIKGKRVVVTVTVTMQLPLEEVKGE